MERYTPEGCLGHGSSATPPRQSKSSRRCSCRCWTAGLRFQICPALKQVIYGASPNTGRTAPRSDPRVGADLQKRLYGQSEASMTITVLGASEHVLDDGRLLTSAGRPWRNLEVPIVDEDRPGTSNTPRRDRRSHGRPAAPDGWLLEPARAHARGVARRLRPTRATWRGPTTRATSTCSAARTT